jgi:hypothetical protein
MRICLFALLFAAGAAVATTASAQTCREDCDSHENECLATCDVRINPVDCIQKCSAASDVCLAKCTPAAGSAAAPTPESSPMFCCTRIGKIGPYTNPSVPFGGVCIGTTPAGYTAKGKACY